MMLLTFFVIEVMTFLQSKISTFVMVTLLEVLDGLNIVVFGSLKILTCFVGVSTC
jgi:hypothetical protein